MNFTFTVADQPLFAHRGPAGWLDDLARFTGIKDALFAEVLDGKTWHVDVNGDENALRFACVALNLHAEQTPWDSTPVEQGAALERVLAGAEPAHDEGIVEALRRLDIPAFHAYTPSRIAFDIDLDGRCRTVLLTTGHNTSGWEAVVDTDGDQYGLEDGPGVNATTEEVVAWVQALQAGGWAEA